MGAKQVFEKSLSRLATSSSVRLIISDEKRPFVPLVIVYSRYDTQALKIFHTSLTVRINETHT